jgi:putative Ca2+/H+ antiporter (TMEM165/GDT1 family)
MTEPAADLARTLAELESRLTVRDQIALDEWGHRKQLSTQILDSFFYVNKYLLIGFGVIFLIETGIVLWLGVTYKRIFETKVLIALVSAITVQFGAIALGVSNWLFPKSRAEKAPERN